MEVSPLNPRAPYEQVADALREEIAKKELKPGDRLPSIRQLAERFGVAAGTVQSALRELKSEGLIVSQQAKGTFVRSGNSGIQFVHEDPRMNAELVRIRELVKEIQALNGQLDPDTVTTADLARIAMLGEELRSRGLRLAALAAIENGSQWLPKP